MTEKLPFSSTDFNQRFVIICIAARRSELDFSLLGQHCRELIVAMENGVKVVSV